MTIKLCVAAVVSTRKKDTKRVDALINAGVDIIVLDKARIALNN